MKKDVKENVKKQSRKSWLFWIALAVVLRMATLSGFKALVSSPGATETAVEAFNETTKEETTEAVETTTEEQTEPETTLSEFDLLPDNIRIASTCMTIVFVGGVLDEEYDLDASYDIKYDIDKSGDGTIEVLYMPSDAGRGRTKVNLTIVKKGKVYTIEYALLAGLYEVDMDTVNEIFKTYYE